MKNNRTLLFLSFFVLVFGTIGACASAAIVDQDQRILTVTAGESLTVTFSNASTTTTTTTTSSGGGGGGVVATEETAAAAEVTVTETVNELLEEVSAEDLGLEGELTAEDVTVTEEAEDSETEMLSLDLVVEVEDEAITEDAKAAIEEVKETIEQTKDAAEITKTLKTYKVASKSDPDQSVYRSKIVVTLKAAKTMKDVKIVEVIPKTTASDVSEISFLGEVPTVLQADPIVQWAFDEVKEGEFKDLSYIVKNEVTTLETTSLAAAAEIVEAPVAVPISEEVPVEAKEEVEPLKPVKDHSWIFWLALLLIVGYGLASYLNTGKLPYGLDKVFEKDL